jgi:uncharacterized membrane protein YedE/YeeE
VAVDWAILGGIVCGALAGGAARYGRLCTMGALEDAMIGGDYRGAKAWGLAAGVAILGTQSLVALGTIDVATAIYLGARVHVVAVMLGGLLFGLGMTLVGTCSFGLIVRAGSGDLRAGVSAVLVGIFAFAATSGALATLRLGIWDTGVMVLPVPRPAALTGIVRAAAGPGFATAIVAVLAALLILPAVIDPRLRKRPRLLGSAVALGAAVTLGWLVTALALDDMTMDRVESLSFVAPVGRALLQLMIEPFRNFGFGVAALAGVALASAAVSVLRGEFRWEAFDDPREMRRHILGAMLMGTGGVLAQGCTIGQGLSATSVLAVTAPLFLVTVAIGARIGLWHLIEGQSLWRLGRRSA